MRQLSRLLGYIRPYSLQFGVSVLLMAAVGLLESFRILGRKAQEDLVLIRET